MPQPKLPVSQHPFPASAICRSSAKGEKYEGTFSDAPSQIPAVHGSGNWSSPYSCPSWLFFHEVVKTGLLMPHSLFSHISNQTTKWKVQDREWGAEGHGLQRQQECWEKSKKERNQDKFAVWHHAILWLGNVRISSCLQILGVSKIMFSNIVISEKYYFHQTCIYVFSSWVPAL